jgi:hypothetical protein
MAQLAPIDRRAATWGVLGVLVAVAVAVLGSGNLRWFDAALVGYLFGTLLPRVVAEKRVHLALRPPEVWSAQWVRSCGWPGPVAWPWRPTSVGPRTGPRSC